MENVYIVKDVHLLNDVLVKCNQDGSELFFDK